MQWPFATHRAMKARKRRTAAKFDGVGIGELFRLGLDFLLGTKRDQDKGLVSGSRIPYA